MKNKSNLLFSIFLLVLIGLIYREWFFSKAIIGGDWPFLFPEFFSHGELVPPAWVFYAGNGLGGKIITYSLDSYLALSYRLGEFLGFQWHYTYKVLWFGLFLAMSSAGSYYLSKTFFEKKAEHILSALIYTTNTYILMVTGGGQMGIALAYALSPIVVGYYLKNLETKSLRYTLFTSLLLGLLLTLDIRIFSVLFIFICVLLVNHAAKQKNIISKTTASIILEKLFLPYVLAFVINSFWILPNLLNPYNPLEQLGPTYTSVESLKFFSFATLSNSISLLHPNWPENIFGKVGFQKPEFLILSILAFASLLFVKKSSKRVIPLVAVSLIGIFLGKGSNDPLGIVYIFLFEKIPIFQMFRDSTKWYLLIALSFSLLIPFTISQLSDLLSKKRLFRIRTGWSVIVPFFFIAVWMFLLKNAIFSQLGGTFSPAQLPQEYIYLKNLLVKDKDFYRVMWVPRQQRFSYSDNNHPAIEALPLFNVTNSARLSDALKKQNTAQYLKSLSVKYVIIPNDSLGEIFLKDRVYNSSERKKYENMLDGIDFIKKIKDGNITIYQTKTFSPLITSTRGKVLYTRVSQTSYRIDFTHTKDEILVFGQKFHPNWKAISGSRIIDSNKTKEGLNSFIIPKSLDKITIVFTEQKNYNISWIVTICALVIIFILILKFKK